MSVIYNNLHVDEQYSSVFEPNLFYGSWLIPGVTYTDKYQTGPAGGYYVHKLQKGDDVVPGAPGRDFSHETVKDDLIQIVLNNNYQKSRKLYQVQINAIDAALGNEVMADTTKLVQEAINGSALAALITEGTSGTVTVVDDDNAKSTLIDVRKSLVKGRAGSAKVILASPDYYAHILAQAGKEFVPAINERIQGNAAVGTWYGFTIFECPQLAANTTYKYFDYAGLEKSVNAAALGKVNFIAYDPQAFSMLTNLAAYRIMDGGKDFVGSVAQAEVNTGFRVTNSELVYISRNAE